MTIPTLFTLNLSGILWIWWTKPSTEIMNPVLSHDGPHVVRCVASLAQARGQVSSQLAMASGPGASAGPLEPESLHLCITFLGCQNKWPQIGWLITTEMYSLTVLEARSLKLGLMGPKSRCQQGCIPSGVPRGKSSSLPFPEFASILGLWPLLSSKTSNVQLSLSHAHHLSFSDSGPPASLFHL